MSTEIGTGQSLPFILYKLRLIGHLLALISVGAVFYELNLHPALLIGLLVYGLSFPHLAYWYASRAKKPRLAEFRSFGFGAVVWGFSVAAMQFNLVPSILILSGLHTEGTGGWPLYWKGLLLFICGILSGIILLGFNFNPESSLFVIMCAAPSMIIFPLILGITNYNLSKRLVRQHREAIHRSRTDGLTGLMNRDFLDVSIEKEFKRCHRQNSISTIVMIDIDHFKKANDKYGHLGGDKIIQQMAELFKEEVRDIDLVARFGGEEYCLCLVDTDTEIATKIAERIRARVENTSLLELNTTCTISCGIAEFSNHYPNYKEWINKADKALYNAKNRGRNRVEIGEPPAIHKQLSLPQ